MLLIHGGRKSPGSVTSRKFTFWRSLAIVSPIAPMTSVVDSQAKRKLPSTLPTGFTKTFFAQFPRPTCDEAGAMHNAQTIGAQNTSETRLQRERGNVQKTSRDTHQREDGLNCRCCPANHRTANLTLPTSKTESHSWMATPTVWPNLIRRVRLYIGYRLVFRVV